MFNESLEFKRLIYVVFEHIRPNSSLPPNPVFIMPSRHSHPISEVVHEQLKPSEVDLVRVHRTDCSHN